MSNIKRVILEQLAKGNLTKSESMELLGLLTRSESRKREDIAIIGMACDLPMSPNVEAFWDNLINNRTCLVNKPANRLHHEQVFKNPYFAEFVGRPVFTPSDEDFERFLGGYVSDIDQFDYEFFNITESEAASIDPQQRLMLQQMWRALEDAGYPEDQITGRRIASFVGRDATNTTDYRRMVELPDEHLSGVWEGILASRISYLFDLRGPAYVVDSACSSGLLAMHLAANALRSGECEMALAGGVAISCGNVDVEAPEDDSDPRSGRPGDVVSRDYRIHAFDGKSSGSVFTEGVAVLVLKTLSAAERDGDHIYGVLAATALNSDGTSNGLTAPNPRAQEELLVAAWKAAGVNPEQVEYVECHGTGTPLGDPIEVLGLKNAFERTTDRKQFCGIGSVKTNIGHTVGASGIAGVIKVLHAMERDVIPASLYFDEPNPHIDFSDSPLYVTDRNTPWPRRDTPRYAGVSSFGFSGTNAHVVLRDHTSARRPAHEVPKPRLFVLSAKSQAALGRYVDQYRTYLAGDVGASLEDICFTAARGRGHYTHRLAIVADTVDELANRIAEQDIGSITPSNGTVHIGHHRIVPQRKTHREPGDVTEAELARLSNQARTLVNELAHTDPSREQLSLLAALYVRGAGIDFAQLFATGHRVCLPTYPFEPSPCWGRPRVSHVADTVPADDWGELPHPLVDRCLVTSLDLGIYEARLSPKTHWPVADHVLMDTFVVAGTVQLEMITEALRHHYGTAGITVADMNYITPVLASPDRDVIVHIRISRDGERDQVEVVSRLDDEGAQWVLNARGHVTPQTGPEPAPEPTLAQLAADPDLERIPAEGIPNFGPGWQHTALGYRSISDPDVTYSVMDFGGDATREDLGQYWLHPGMLDCAFSHIQILVFMAPNFFLPLGYEGLELRGRLSRRFYARSRRVHANDDVMVFEITLVNEDGTVIGQVDRYSMKRVPKFNEFTSSSFYGLQWHETTEPGARKPWQRPILLVSSAEVDSSPWQRELATCAPAVHEIILGEENHVLAPNRVMASVDDSSIEWAVRQLPTDQFDAAVVVTGWNPDRAAWDDADLDRGISQGVDGLVHLTKLLQTRAKGGLDLVVVADHAHQIDGDEPFIDASHTALLAMTKSLKHECVTFCHKAIDTDGRTEIATLVNEALSAGTGPTLVGYRRGVRYQPVLVESTSQDFPSVSKAGDASGIYLVTGGAGALGSATGMALAQSKAPVCLVSRRPLPDRSQWEALACVDDRTGRIVRNLLEIQATGAPLELECADVTDEAQMSQLIGRLRATYGRIRGVVHCAGTAGDGFLFSKDLETFHQVLDPKAAGLRNLYRILGDEPDLYLSFSSMTSLLGGAGQSDYTAANSFLDGFTTELRRRGIKARVINWPGWSEIGMAVDHGVDDSRAPFESLSTHSALNVVNEAMMFRDITHVIPSNLNAQVFAAIEPGYFCFANSDAINRRLARESARLERETAVQDHGAAPVAIDPNDVAILGKPDSELDDVERTVACVYAVVIGISEIDIYDTFTALGGNSIMATEMMKVLNGHFDDVLSISDIFTYATPAEMAAHISEVLGIGSVVEEETPAQGSYNELIGQLESGEIDADSLLAYIGQN